MQTPRRSHLAIALFCIIAGGLLILVALGVIATSPGQRHAPDFIIAFSGLAFIIAGCMILVGRQSRFNDLLAAILCLLFGATGAWVALYSPSEGFSGGIPLLSNEANVRLARWVFGLGSLVCFAIAGWAFKRYRSKLQ
jgi:divalent metal cation (Fe/Co/Zn/Cd) transporter